MPNRIKSLKYATIITLGFLVQSNTTPTQAAEPAHSQTQIQTLLNKVTALESQVNELRTQSHDSWMTQRRAEEVKALISNVLADADTRASFAGDATRLTMINNGIALSSDDGNFLMKFGGLIQARWIGDFRDDSGQDDNETGFDLRRVEMVFSGHVITPELGYTLVFATSGPDDQSIIAQDVAVTYALDENWTIAGGRYFAPLLREELVGGGDSIAVALSYMNNTLSIGRSDGISLKYEDDSLRGHLYFSDGTGGGGADFSNDNTDWSITARGDLKLAGEWNQWMSFTNNSSEERAIFIGAAYHAQGGERGENAANPADFTAWTVDGSIEDNGFHLYAAFAGNSTDTDGGTDADNYGVVAQLGYMLVPDKLEPFIRYEQVMFDDDLLYAESDVSLITVGANYYLNTNAKLAFDVVYALDPVPTNSPNAGLLADGVDDGQTVVRAQFQLKF